MILLRGTSSILLVVPVVRKLLGRDLPKYLHLYHCPILLSIYCASWAIETCFLEQLSRTLCSILMYNNLINTLYLSYACAHICYTMGSI
jgi:hypothetical protein